MWQVEGEGQSFSLDFNIAKVTAGCARPEPQRLAFTLVVGGWGGVTGEIVYCEFVAFPTGHPRHRRRVYANGQ